MTQKHLATCSVISTFYVMHATVYR